MRKVFRILLLAGFLCSGTAAFAGESGDVFADMKARFEQLFNGSKKSSVHRGGKRHHHRRVHHRRHHRGRRR